MILTTISLPAFATTATFTGKYASYPAGTHHFEVRVGETIDMEGYCAADGHFLWTYDSLWYTEWTVDGVSSNDEFRAPNNSAGVKKQSFVVSGPPGRTFGVKMQCFSNNNPTFTHDYVSRQFTILAPAPPSVAWRNTNAEYANGKITITADVTGTGDGVNNDGVYIWWTGESSTSIKMQHAGGSAFQYEIDASNLPEGTKDVQIWAVSKSGDNKGWKSVGSFIVDHSKPVIDWDDKNPEYAKTSITIDANISDTASGVSDVWIWWTGARSTSIQMINAGGDLYRYTIDTSRLPAGVTDVRIWARDKVGNETNWQSKGRFTVDHLPPEIEWDDTNAPFANNANAADDGITIKANISDAASGVDDVWIWWTGAPSTNIKMLNRGGGHYDYRIGSLPDGVKDVQIFAGDNLGNSTGWVSKGSFISDTTPPVVNWLEPSDQDALSNGRIHIAGNIVDDYPDYVVIEWQQENDRTWRSHTLSIDRADHGEFQYDLSHLTQGVDYLLRMHAADKAGNVSADTPQRTVIGQFRPAGKALRLQMESMQADWKYTQDTAFDYRMTIGALQWRLSGLELRYALPAGLLKNGEVRIDADGAADINGKRNTSITLNPDWGPGDDRLLSPAHDATLPARSSFIITIPVRVAKTAISGTFIQSELQGIANNLRGKAFTTDRITLDAAPLDDEQLRLEKTVDKKTALPGETLHYTITFTNVSTEDLSEIVIKDTIQSTYLTLRSVQCGRPMPNGLQCGNAVPRKPGTLEWHFNGVLAAGESGSVSYEAQVNTK
jgi:uncharacterized repeat protein (TIGR01451 family)